MESQLEFNKEVTQDLLANFGRDDQGNWASIGIGKLLEAVMAFKREIVP